MLPPSTRSSGPSWDQLYETAAAQEGYFTTAQAAGAGYYPQLLAKHLRSGRIIRARRGVYRLVHFPPGDNEDLIVVWLWSERQGVFSHETALALHRLSDALPSKAHLTLPKKWDRRRLRVPGDVVLHYAELPLDDRTWVGAIPVTSAARTLLDCAAVRVAPELVRQAIEEAVERGLLTRDMVVTATDYLATFGEESP